MKLWIAAFAVVIAGTVSAQQAMSPDAPKDQPKSFTDKAALEMDRATAPYVAQARATYPVVKARFLSGELKRPFFVTVRLGDDLRFEDSYVRVVNIDSSNGDIKGRIASELNAVTKYHLGQQITVREADIRDWTISNVDGSEEGNFVGKFLDSYRQ